MKAPRTSQAVAFGVMVSIGLHAFAAAALSRLPSPERAAPASVVEVAITTARATPDVVAPSEPEPDPEPEPATVKGNVARSQPAETIAPAAAEPEAVPDPSPEAPIDLTGTTLTASGGAWAAPQGNGRASTGPIRAPRRAKRTAVIPTAPVATAAKPVPRARSVAAQSLSRPPPSPEPRWHASSPLSCFSAGPWCRGRSPRERAHPRRWSGWGSDGAQRVLPRLWACLPGYGSRVQVVAAVGRVRPAGRHHRSLPLPFSRGFVNGHS